jgi:hypothetical protein
MQSLLLKVCITCSHDFFLLQQAFKMAGYVFFYMDTWSKSEILLCQELLYPDVPVIVVQKHYSM